MPMSQVCRLLAVLFTFILNMGFKIMSINTCGLNHSAKRFCLWHKARNTHAKIECAQETHFNLKATLKSSHKYFPNFYLV